MARLAVARLSFCANSFVPRRTTVADVAVGERYGCDDLWARSHEPGQEFEGLASFLAARPGWNARLLCDAVAPPGGPLCSEAFGAWIASVEHGLRQCRFDGVYLALHGACQAEGDPAADLTILRRVRAVMGRVPVVASFDRHANLPDEVVLLLDGASGSRGGERGGAEAAGRALALLEGILDGRIRPVGAVVRGPVLPAGPLVDSGLDHLAAPAGGGGSLLDASLFAGFAWADSPHAGASVMVWADRDAGRARAEAARLAAGFAAVRSRAAVPLPSPGVALAALSGQGKVLLLDAADDPALGGPADTPAVLAAVLAQAAGTAGLRAGVALFQDERTVAQASSAGVGGRISCALGGRLSRQFGPPVALEAEIVRLVAPEPETGAMAVLRGGGVDILLSDRRPAVISPALLRRAGMLTDDLGLLAVKGGDRLRPAFAPLFPIVATCVCPGPTSPFPAALRHLFTPPARLAVDGPGQRASEVSERRNGQPGAKIAPKHSESARTSGP
jgi:microcystin degradation protein MlrC